MSYLINAILDSLVGKYALGIEVAESAIELS